MAEDTAAKDDEGVAATLALGLWTLEGVLALTEGALLVGRLLLPPLLAELVSLRMAEEGRADAEDGAPRSADVRGAALTARGDEVDTFAEVPRSASADGVSRGRFEDTGVGAGAASTVRIGAGGVQLLSEM